MAVASPPKLPRSMVKAKGQEKTSGTHNMFDVFFEDTKNQAGDGVSSLEADANSNEIVSGTEDFPGQGNDAHDQDLGDDWNDTMNIDSGSYGRLSGSSETSPGDNQDMNNDDMESPEDPSDPGDDLAGDDRSTDEETDTDKAELDEVEPEDLMRILQEWFGDEWQQQLHDLHLDNISAFALCLEGSGLPQSTLLTGLKSMNDGTTTMKRSTSQLVCSMCMPCSMSPPTSIS
ncbi:hypothetical protein K439DRAFT_1555723, partial [Ramaria rubella]